MSITPSASEWITSALVPAGLLRSPEAMSYALLEEFFVEFLGRAAPGPECQQPLTMLWTWQHGDISANKM
jgi:hypothetical protein